MRSAAVLLAAALSGCGGGATSDADYFPAAVGASWTYQASTWTQPGSWTTTVSVPGTIAVGGRQAWIFKEDNRRRVGDAHETYLAADARAITFVGESPASDPMMDAAAWDLDRFDGTFGAAPLLTVEMPGDGDALAHGQPWKLEVFADTGDETIATPAGTFETKRFHYVFEATYQDGYVVTHNLTEWRALGIGVVRQEYADGVQLGSTNWAKELLSYSLPSS